MKTTDEKIDREYENLQKIFFIQKRLSEREGIIRNKLQRLENQAERERQKV